MPLAVLGVRRLIRRARIIIGKQIAHTSGFMRTMMETVQGVRIIKAYNLETQMRERMHKSIADMESNANKMARVSSRTGPLMETLGGLAVAAVVMYAGYGVIVGRAQPGEFFAVITALLIAYEPAKRLARMNVELSSHLVLAPFVWDFASPTSRATVVLPGFFRFACQDGVSQLALNTFYREKRVANGSEWEFHFFPFFSYGQSPTGHWWNVLYGLAGYTRDGTNSKMRLAYIPITLSK